MLNLQNNSTCGCYYYPCFTDAQSKAQRDEVACSGCPEKERGNFFFKSKDRAPNSYTHYNRKDTKLKILRGL